MYYVIFAVSGIDIHTGDFLDMSLTCNDGEKPPSVGDVVSVPDYDSDFRAYTRSVRITSCEILGDGDTENDPF